MSMSLTSATPSTASRGSFAKRARIRQSGASGIRRSEVRRSAGRRSEVGRSGVAGLHVVQDEQPALPVRRPVQAYRSELSLRTPAQVRTVTPGLSKSPAPYPRSAPPVRLTRRGRIVVRFGAAALVLLTIVSGVLLLDRTAEAGSTSRPVPVSYRVVLPGETLWQIAGEVAPDVDRRDTVARILELNALSTAGVRAGQRIAFPVQVP
jgi:hypothetical protein